MKYAWIKQHQGEFTVLSMCRFLQVSQSAYYDWLHRIPSFREREDEQLSSIVKKLFKKSRNTYGTRRLKIAMSHQGRSVGRRRISRLMKEAGLACKTKRRFKATTHSKHELPIAPNYLDRQFSIDQINQVYVGDLTYIHTLEGWLYLAVVIDLFSRQVVGWSMAAHMKTQLVNDALQMAIWKRKPDKGLLWHTDRGSQYASESHRQLLKQHGIQQSMSRKGNCWDNAVSESFFHTLKIELIHHQTFHSREEAKQAVFEYIEVFYNRERLHSANGYISPVDFELQQNAA
ncbi:transposase InsO family protein [Nitrosomonas eutropha]|uniref:Transposase InsO family protein n=1 Tax=Nitrosomonas eutropha TaxID=916 RepID=A0ABX5M5R6_9PROT|nr:IS3 family transposase [Nitrosomonas eutropha]PXV73414.1 transposase InsO family protein [Nitrosomonas eutropha]SEJ32934.1 Transposase InsO and inactivated derivatives [Nitrosomonas eutropha]